jgi:polyisoprenoid-binding protein YceI
MRKNFAVVVLLMLVLLLNAAFGQVQIYNIDKVHSQIGFEVTARLGSKSLTW